MRRIATIILTIVIVLGLGGGAYAYVASQRSWWPFGNSTMSTITSNGFSNLVTKDLAVYAYLDLANPAVAARVSNPALIQNINTIKAGFQKWGNDFVQNTTAMVTDDVEKQKAQTEMVQAFQYISGKKIHIAWDNSMPTPAGTGELPGNVIVGIEVNGYEDANQFLVTLKAFINNEDGGAAVEELVINNQPVSKIGDRNNGSPTAFIANIGNKYLVITTNQPAMENVIARNHTPSPDDFAHNDTFVALANKITGAQLATFYIDNARYITALEGAAESDLNENEAKLQKALLQSPLYRSSTITGVSLNDKGLIAESYTAFGDNQVAQQFANSSSSFANSMPNDTLFFEEGHNLTQMISLYVAPIMSILETDTSMNPEESPQAMIAAFEEATGISIQNDLAPLFTKTSALTVHRSESIIMPVAISLLTEITNRSGAETTMDKLANALIAQTSLEGGVAVSEPTTSEVAGVTVHSAGQLDGLESVLNYATTADGKNLLVSSSLNAVETILDIMKAPANSLAQSPKYPEILKNVPANNMIIYLDLRGILDAFAPLLTLTFDPEMAQMYNSEVKPYLDTLNNIAGYNTVEGNMMKSVLQVQLVN